MSFKKVLPILFLLTASIACTDEKKKPTVESPTQQTPPPTASVQPPASPTPAEVVKPSPAPASPLPTEAAKTAPASADEITSSYEGAFVRMLVTLLGLVILVFATFWVLKRMGKGKFGMGGGRGINVIEKRALSPKSMLYIVEISGKKVLISESQVEVRALTTIEEIPGVDE